MDYNDIYGVIDNIIDKFEKSSMTSLEIDFHDVKMKMKREKEIVSMPQLAQHQMIPQISYDPNNIVQIDEPDDGNFITAPIVGVFYASPSPSEPAFVKVGEKVKKGEIVCIIEAMKMMNEIPAPCDCEIVGVVAGNEQLAEFGAKLFEIREL